MDEFAPQIGPPEKAMGAVPPAPPPLGDPDAPDKPEIIPEVTEGMVRSILAGLGNVASVIDRQPAAPNLWKFTPEELDQLAPPITRLANRNPVLARALLHGDLVVIFMTLGEYGVRNVMTRKEATDAQGHASEALRAAGPDGSGYGPGSPGWRQPDATGGSNGAPVRPTVPQ